MRLGSGPTPAVSWLQGQLLTFGCGPLTVDGTYGPATQAAVRMFQVRRGLAADGVTGAATWAALRNTTLDYALAPSGALTSAALRIAQAMIGTSEVGGNNRGPQIELFLASVGLGAGHPWCMAFQFWAFAKAATTLRMPNPVPRTGSVLRCWEQAPDAAKIRPEEVEEDLRIVKPGALYLMDFGHDKGHVGMVVAATADGLRGVEGNTNLAGGREGDCVRARGRRYSDVNLGYLDFGLLV